MTPDTFIENEQILGIVMKRGHISLREFFKIFNKTQDRYQINDELVLDIIYKAIIAIRELHRCGVIHCDIKG